ncbi:hypothetical protein DYB30_009787 [Aphanomyces astaci]|uniref:Uncharacterized protein n=1 Tax=Aphanomyces astaci TaxID=112090 RepID=A0A397CFF2_APHAT|nr:hypothetical protein DYB30_009787 [Aphanomyces astaci]
MALQCRCQPTTTRGKPHIPRRDSSQKDAAKNNGRVGRRAETIVPKKGCLKCRDMIKRWKDGIKVLVNQPQRQKTEHGVLLENVVRVDDVLLDSDSDVTVVTRRVMDALDAAGINVGTVSHSVPHLTYPYGSDAKPVVMTRSVKFNCVTLDTTCGLLVLRGLKAWVDDASTAAELIVSRPVMALLGLSVEDLLVGVEPATMQQRRYMNAERKALLQEFHASVINDYQFSKQHAIPPATWKGLRANEAKILAIRRHGRLATIGGQGRKSLFPFKDDLLEYMRGRRVDRLRLP